MRIRVKNCFNMPGIGVIRLFGIETQKTLLVHLRFFDFELLSVKYSESSEVKAVTEQQGLDLFVQETRATQGGAYINLQ